MLGEKKNTIFKSWISPGPHSDQIRKIGPEWAPEMKQNIGNPYQTKDNKNPRGAAQSAALLGGAEGAALLSSIW